MDIFHFSGNIPSRMQVSMIILIGVTIDESQIFNTRGETSSHPQDLLGSRAVMISRIFTSENVIKERLSGVL